MRILHITAQKPNSTGSGVYMNGVVESLRNLGHEQAVIAGIDIEEDKSYIFNDVSFYPVIYGGEKLSFPVVGMSDIMPYKSTRYKDLTGDMVRRIKGEFTMVLNKAIGEFKPDIIICNHLYLITSFVRELVKDIKVVGICHGTCLRQLKNIDLEKEYIISNISKLDSILVLHEEQKKDVMNIFNLQEDKVIVIGSGYDDKIFYNKKVDKNKDSISISYAGKICKSKGLKSLLLSLDKLNYDEKYIKLNLAGSSSDNCVLKELEEIADGSKYEVNFLGRLNHQELASLFNQSDIFILPSFYEGLPVVVLEALACGCKVIVSRINGLDKFLGEDINNSNNIYYVDLPKMKSVGIPFKKELPQFEENLAISIEDCINEISSYKEISMKDKTWDGLGQRVEKILVSLNK